MPDVDLAFYEQLAAAQVRGMAMEPAGWGELLAAGQWGMTAAQTSDRDDIDGDSLLIPTARILDSMSRGASGNEPRHR
jgi:hypothetical protein